MPQRLFDPSASGQVLETSALAALFEGMPDAVLLADAERRIVLANPAAEQIFGYSASELIGNRTRMLYADSADYEATGRKHFNPLSTANTGVYEIRYQRKSGETFPSETTGSTVRDADGTVLGYLGIIRDISRQRQIQEVMQALYAKTADQELSSDEKIQEILALGARHFRMPLGIVSHVRGTTYTVLHATSPGGEVTPGSTFDVRGTYCTHTLQTDGPTAFAHVGESALAAHPCYRTFRLESYIGVPLWVDGERFGTLNFSSWQPHAPFEDADRELIQLFAQWISHELSLARAFDAVRQAKREAEVARTEAERANAAKSRFLATVSHDLRTPLTGLMGMLDLLSTSRLDSEERAYVEHARTSAQALLDLLNDTLDVSKIESGHMQFERAPVHVPELVRSVAALFEPKARQAGVALQVSVADRCPTRVLGDSVRLRQILTNLVSNALKFTSEGEVRIEAGAGPGGTGVCLAVQDTGPGIPAARQRTIFEPFQQADAATTREHGGTGLGLAISKQLAEGMGGRIDLASSPGAGSRFDVVLPLEHAAEAEAAPDGAGSQSAEGPEPLSLLVAEDNPTNGLLLRTVLERDGHSVHLVTDGEAAVEAARREPFDAAIVDVHMPGTGGLEAARRIRAGDARNPDLPVVALTADAVSGNREGYTDAGVAAVLTKPISWAAVRRTLAELTAAGGEAPRTETDAPAEAGRYAELPLIDPDRTAELRAALGSAGCAELMASFRDSLLDERERVANAHRRDPADARAAMHTLKGVALNYGARRLGAVCADAQTRAEAGELSQAMTAEVLAALDATLAEVRAASDDGASAA
ncbi:PAS domain S-box-containing protein [Limimonas halophila]|uniref:histidine kinase n=1 Tax=Limimonas halophila TaxID=1082479 RepID=A0A1G7RKL7_9PROT|nr:ATP-binding protein [Limimonas halophila]SDG11288.1 PAS domain S-box-containing protein [Limimonas halophila]